MTGELDIQADSSGVVWFSGAKDSSWRGSNQIKGRTISKIEQQVSIDLSHSPSRSWIGEAETEAKARERIKEREVKDCILFFVDWRGGEKEGMRDRGGEKESGAKKPHPL